MPGLLDLIAARNPEQAGGLLSDLVAAPRNRLRGLLDNPIGFANDALQEGLFGPPEVRAARDKFWNKEPMTDLEKQAYTNQLLNMGMAGLTVYHGSPHKFDKFDMSKIGTGEGAQAYGHGLYFAESPEVARQYALDVKPKDASQFLAPRTNVTQNAIDYFKAMLEGKVPRDVKNGSQVSDEYIKSQIVQLQDELPQLYKVDLPDESIAKMLDWDKPLSQQSQNVRSALSELMRKKNPALAAYWEKSGGLDDAGLRALRQRLGLNVFDTIDAAGAAVQALGDPATISTALRNYGVPGIRYLDAGSRDIGKGTHNYVVFDDTLPTILERNGQKLK